MPRQVELRTVRSSALTRCGVVCGAGSAAAATAAADDDVVSLIDTRPLRRREPPTSRSGSQGASDADVAPFASPPPAAPPAHCRPRRWVGAVCGGSHEEENRIAARVAPATAALRRVLNRGQYEWVVEG